MNWRVYEKQGWHRESGRIAMSGLYYSLAWRKLPKPIKVNGIIHCHEYVMETGESSSEAEDKFKLRMEQL